jgi:hypothetical protein
MPNKPHNLGYADRLTNELELHRRRLQKNSIGQRILSWIGAVIYLIVGAFIVAAAMLRPGDFSVERGTFTVIGGLVLVRGVFVAREAFR